MSYQPDLIYFCAEWLFVYRHVVHVLFWFDSHTEADKNLHIYKANFRKEYFQ